MWNLSLWFAIEIPAMLFVIFVLGSHADVLTYHISGISNELRYRWHKSTDLFLEATGTEKKVKSLISDGPRDRKSDF